MLSAVGARKRPLFSHLVSLLLPTPGFSRTVLHLASWGTSQGRLQKSLEGSDRKAPASADSTVVCVLEPEASAEPQFSGGTLSRPSRVRVLVPWPAADTFKSTKWQLFLWPCHVLLYWGMNAWVPGPGMWTNWWDMVPLAPPAFSHVCQVLLGPCRQGFEDGEELALAERHSFWALSLALCVEFFLKKAPGSFLRVGRKGSSLGRAGLLFSRAP